MDSFNIINFLTFDIFPKYTSLLDIKNNVSNNKNINNNIKINDVIQQEENMKHNNYLVEIINYLIGIDISLINVIDDFFTIFNTLKYFSDDDIYYYGDDNNH